MTAHDNRPFILNLLKIRLPISGIVSIFHRLSGMFIFLLIPWFIYLMDLSVQGTEGFQQAAEILNQNFSRFVLFIFAWALLHHFFAGIRFLLMDFDIGLSKTSSIKSAWLVIAAEVLSLILLLLGVCS